MVTRVPKEHSKVFFDGQGTGQLSNMVYAVGQHASRKNEDTYLAHMAKIEGLCDAVFGVFDGHNGPRAAQFLEHNIIRKLEDKVNNLSLYLQDTEDEGWPSELDNILVEFFKELDAMVLDQMQDGTTCTLLLLKLDPQGSGNILAKCAWVGDSRLCLHSNNIHVDISEDHRASNPNEKKRIVSDSMNRLQQDNTAGWRKSGVLTRADIDRINAASSVLINHDAFTVDSSLEYVAGDSGRGLSQKRIQLSSDEVQVYNDSALSVEEAKELVAKNGSRRSSGSLDDDSNPIQRKHSFPHIENRRESIEVEESRISVESLPNTPTIRMEAWSIDMEVDKVRGGNGGSLRGGGYFAQGIPEHPNNVSTHPLRTMPFDPTKKQVRSQSTSSNHSANRSYRGMKSPMKSNMAPVAATPRMEIHDNLHGRLVAHPSTHDIASLADSNPDIVFTGKYMTQGGQMVGDERIFLPNMNSLMCTRTIGDRDSKLAAGKTISSDPGIKNFTIQQNENARVILATDGLWDVFDSKQTHQKTAKSKEIRKAVPKLLKDIYNDTLYSGKSRDDITIVMIEFNGSPLKPKSAGLFSCFGA